MLYPDKLNLAEFKFAKLKLVKHLTLYGCCFKICQVPCSTFASLQIKVAEPLENLVVSQYTAQSKTNYFALNPRSGLGHNNLEF